MDKTTECKRCERTAYINETEDVLGYQVCRECKPKLTLGDFLRMRNRARAKYAHKSWTIHALMGFPKQLLLP